MSPNLFHLVTLFLAFSLFSLANAALYVVTPRDQSTCRGGEPCTVTWLDDGRAPLLTAIGVSTIGLYTGQKKIVQTLPPVDVSANLSFVFTPDPDAGPNSDSYYLAFTSTQAKNGTGFYEAFSPWFRLEGMKGSFDSPDPSATKSIPIPSTLSNKPTTSTTMTTITVGTLSTAIPDPPISISTPTTTPTASSTTSSSSSSTTPRIVTSTTPLSTSTTSAASSSTNAPLNNGALSRSPLALPVICIGLLISTLLIS